MRAMADGRGDGPVEPGLNGISMWFLQKSKEAVAYWKL